MELTARDGEVVSGYFTGSEGGIRNPWSSWCTEVRGPRTSGDGIPRRSFWRPAGGGSAKSTTGARWGFGRRFQEAGAGAWTGVSKDDLLDGVRWAVGKGWVDPSQIVVVGGSFGGYLAFAAMTDEKSIPGGGHPRGV